MLYIYPNCGGIGDHPGAMTARRFLLFFMKGSPRPELEEGEKRRGRAFLNWIDNHRLGLFLACTRPREGVKVLAAIYFN